MNVNMLEISADRPRRKRGEIPSGPADFDRLMRSSRGGTGYSFSLGGDSINLRREYINADDVMHLIKIG